MRLIDYISYENQVYVLVILTCLLVYGAGWAFLRRFCPTPKKFHGETYESRTIIRKPGDQKGS